MGLKEPAPESPFYNVDGTQKAVTFDSDLLGRVTLFGGESNPEIVAGPC
jgi:homoserine dehydrogenase